MSQEELAERLGVSRQAVSRWESGATQPDAFNILQLSKLFRVTADYLLDDDYEDAQGVSAVKIGTDSAKAKIKKGIALCVSAFGALGILLIYSLSRFIEVMIPHITYENGTKIYTWSGNLTGRSYKYFIQEYDLEFLVFLFYGALAVGLLYILANNGRIKGAVLSCKEKIHAAVRK